jgi:uncharacterized protein YaaR (DUF327 family)
MRSFAFQNIGYLPLLTLGVLPFLSASAAISGNSSPGMECQVAQNASEEAKNLLEQVQHLSGKLKKDAATLESYKRQTQFTWQTHANQLNLAREHINQIGDRLDRLQKLQPEVAPWQQAIEQIVPVAAQVAAHTEAAINHLSDNRTYLFAPVYREHLTSIANRSAELKNSVDLFVEFSHTSDKLAATQQKLDQLREKIGTSES